MKPAAAVRPPRTSRGARTARALRLGMLGGTFDPPHVGHLAIAEWAREQLELDRVIFVPSGTPPHKAGRVLSQAAARLAMIRLAARGNPAFEVSPIEIRRRGPSFTIDTVRALRLEHPASRLFLILGADSLEEFHTWRDPDAIAAEATLAVARRPDAGRPPQHRVRSRRFVRSVVWLDNPGLDLSSSAIRARARRGRSLRYLVPETVTRYITRRRLYRGRP